MPKRFTDLLDATPPESLVRRALALLEADFRRLALIALADWQATGVVSHVLFETLGNLQRPSWGSWKGMLDALRKARVTSLRTGSEDEKRRVGDARRLESIFALLDSRVPLETLDELKPLGELTRTKLSGATLFTVLSLPITLRNDVAHQAPAPSSAWWDNAARGLRPLLEFHRKGALGLHDLLRAADLPEPWFVNEAGRVFSFNGFTHDYATRFAPDDEGEPRTDETRSAALLQAIAKLLGESESNEKDLRKLLKKLAPEEMKGVVLDDYLVGPPVGEGGFATVHLGRQLSTGRKVAVKVLRDKAESDDVARFQKEAEYLSLLNHPNIVQVIGYGEAAWLAPRNVELSGEAWFETIFAKGKPVKPYIALEWIDGETLDQIYTRIQKGEGERPAHETLVDYLRQAARALAVVHGVGLIHRDIKPSNLMVTREGQIKLMDFGIARSQSAARTIQTRSGEAPGTLAYMSPEQLRMRHAETDVGPASDIYSLCATFYELFSGRRFFAWDEDESKASQKRFTETSQYKRENLMRPAPPIISVKGANWEMRTLLMGGLEPEPKDRPTALQLDNDVGRALANEPMAYRQPGTLRRMRLAYRRNVLLWNAAVVFVIAAMLGASLYIWQITEEQANTAMQRDIAQENARKEAAAKTLAQKNEVEANRQREIAGKNADTAKENANKEAAQRKLAEENLRLAKQSLAKVHSEKAAAASVLGQFQTAAAHLNAARGEDPEGGDSTALNLALAKGEGPCWTSPASFPGFWGTFSLTPDGRYAVGPSGSECRIWDVATGKQIRTFRSNESAVTCAAVSPDGRFVVCGRADHSLSLWNVKTGALLRTLRGHKDSVSCITFSPDGRLVLSGSNDRVLLLWDVETGESLRNFEGHSGAVVCTAFSPDGQLALSGSKDKTLRLWELKSGKSLRTFQGHTGEVCCAAFSPDGSSALSGGQDNTLRLWDVETAKLVRTFEGHRHWVMSVAFSADGRFALSGAADWYVGLWNLTTGEVTKAFEGHTAAVLSVAFSSDGGFVLSGSVDATLRVWEVESGKSLRAFEGHSNSVSAVAFSPDGRFALSGSHDRTLQLWDVETGKHLRTMSGSRGTISCVVISPDGRRALSCGGEPMPRLWDLDTGQLIRTFEGQPLEASGVAFSPDGRLALSCGQSGSLTIWSVETGALVRNIKAKTDTYLRCAAFSPDGRFVVAGVDRGLKRWETASGDLIQELFDEDLSTAWITYVAYSKDGQTLMTGSANGTGRFWSVYSGKVFRRFAMTEGHLSSPQVSFLFSPDGGFAVSSSLLDGRIRLWDVSSGLLIRTFEGDPSSTCLALSPDGGLILSGGGDKALRLFRLRAGQSTRVFRGHTRQVLSVALSADGRCALSGSYDHTLRYWDIETGIALRIFEGHSNVVSSVALSPDGRFALSGSYDKTLRLWDVATGKLQQSFEGHTNGISCVAFKPDGRIALSGSWDKTLRLWDVETGTSLRTLEGHTEAVYGVAISPDGRFALSASGDKTLRLWDLDSGQIVRTYYGHTSIVFSVAISPDGRFALSGSDDESIRLWDLESGQSLRKFFGHTDPVVSVVFSRDGRLALSGGLDRTVRLWELETGQLVETRSEWGTGQIYSVVLSPDGKFALTGCDKKSLNVWEMQTPMDLSRAKPTLTKAAFARLTGVYIDGLLPVMVGPPEADPRWLTPNGQAPGFLNGPPSKRIPSSSVVDLKVDNATSVWLHEWDSTRRSSVRGTIDAWRRLWNDQFEGYRYCEEKDTDGTTRRILVPARSKDATGRYIGEPEGNIDYAKWWDETIKPKFGEKR